MAQNKGNYSNPAVTSQPMQSQLIFENEWSSGLCDCCSDVKSCCLAYWCWPIFLCCLDSKAKECVCTQYCISLLSSGSSAGIAILRAKIRGTYRIKGSVINDCCCAACCSCCVALQIYRELTYRGEV